MTSTKFPPVREQMDRITSGTLEVLSEADLERKLEESIRDGRPLRVKQGFDPTRPDLHIGHAVSLRKLRDFQELGHEVVFVLGDYTARIGDPTGRSEMRPRLTPEEIEENAHTYRDQVALVLDPRKTRVEPNSSWLASLDLADILELTSRYTVARMLERDDFSKRHAEGTPIWLSEFLYPLMQAYDSVALEADVELGGNDQKFNLLAARAIQERYGQTPQVCVIMPLLRGTDGDRKMSKSYDNYVGLADAPEEQYGRTMSIPDALLEEWWRHAAALPEGEVADALARASSDPYPSKRALARRIVALYHDEEAAAAAEAHFDRVHRERGVPEEVPEIEVRTDEEALEVEAGEVWLPRLLVRAELAPSNSQAARFIEQGAVSVDGEKVRDRQHRLPARGEYLLQRGKRRFARVRFAG